MKGIICILLCLTLMFSAVAISSWLYPKNSLVPVMISWILASIYCKAIEIIKPWEE